MNGPLLVKGDDQFSHAKNGSHPAIKSGVFCIPSNEERLYVHKPLPTRDGSYQILYSVLSMKKAFVIFVRYEIY